MLTWLDGWVTTVDLSQVEGWCSSQNQPAPHLKPPLSPSSGFKLGYGVGWHTWHNSGTLSLWSDHHICLTSESFSHYHISAFHFSSHFWAVPPLACNLWSFLSVYCFSHLPHFCTPSLSFSISQSLLYNQSVLNYEFASSPSAAFSRSHWGRR